MAAGRHVVQANIAHDAAQMPAGKNIVTDDCNAPRRERGSTNVQDLVLHDARHPAEHAMANDVVEGMGCKLGFGQIAVSQVNVVELEGCNPLRPSADVLE